jgi:hypothetical protein
MKQTNQHVQQAAATLCALAPEVAAHGTGRVRCLYARWADCEAAKLSEWGVCQEIPPERVL